MTDELDPNEETPEFARGFEACRSEHEMQISALATELRSAHGEDLELDDDHWELIALVKDAMGTHSANDSTDEEEDQEDALEDAESWVEDNLSGGDFATDIEMAFFLHGPEAGEAFIRKAVQDLLKIKPSTPKAG